MARNQRVFGGSRRTALPDMRDLRRSGAENPAVPTACSTRRCDDHRVCSGTDSKRCYQGPLATDCVDSRAARPHRKTSHGARNASLLEVKHVFLTLDVNERPGESAPLQLALAAFTGAVGIRQGRLEVADGGTSRRWPKGGSARISTTA